MYLELTFSSTVTTTSSCTTMPTAPFRSSTPRPRRRIPALWEWRKRSRTAAKCAASATRISTVSNITNRTRRRVIPNSNSPRVATCSPAVSCRDRTSTWPGLASPGLVKRACYSRFFYEFWTIFFFSILHNSIRLIPTARSRLRFMMMVQ